MDDRRAAKAHDTVEVTPGERPVRFPAGGLFDRYRMQADLDEVAKDARVAGVGSLVSREQLDTVVRHVEDVKSKGVTVLAGGRRRPGLGPFFFDPTILTDVDDTTEVYAHGTFGPVVSVYRVADENEAFAGANDSEYGLNFSVWTSDERRGRRVAARLQAGTVTVNDVCAAA